MPTDSPSEITVTVIINHSEGRSFKWGFICATAVPSRENRSTLQQGQIATALFLQCAPAAPTLSFFNLTSSSRINVTILGFLWKPVVLHSVDVLETNVSIYTEFFI